MRRSLVKLGLVLLFFGVGAAPASGAVSVSVGGSVEITGTAAAETVTVAAVANTITVASPQGVEGACGTGLEVACPVDPSTTVRAELGGGEDTIDASILDRTVIVRAADGGDTVRTGAAADSIVLEGERNVVQAGAGEDVISAAGTVRGGPGDDWLTGDGTLDGGPGDDALEGIMNAILIGGGGIDTARFALDGETRISLDGVANDGAWLFASDVRADVEVLQGGASDDVLVGTAGAQELDGGAGADILDGGDGADVLDGGDDADVLTGGPGGDTLRGDEGDDALDSLDGEVDDVECGGGADTARVDAADRTSGCEQVDAVPIPSPTADPTPVPVVAPAAPPVTAAAVDPPPTVRVSLAARVGRGTFMRRGVVAMVRCSESCTVSAVLTLDARTAKRLKLPRRLARAGGTLASAGSLRVRVKPTASVRRRLTRVKRSVNAILTTTAIDAAGHARVVTRRLRISP